MGKVEEGFAKGKPVYVGALTHKKGNRTGLRKKSLPSSSKQ